MDGGRTQVKHNNSDENNNRYDLLFSEPKCYICHNYGHKAANCRLRNFKRDSNPTTENFKIWKKKEDVKCRLVLSGPPKNSPWYIDSGCSKHMTRDKSKFLTLSESKSENVTFGNDAPGKIKGKGMLSLSNGKGKDQYVLFVEGMKHNNSYEHNNRYDLLFNEPNVTFPDLLSLRVRNLLLSLVICLEHPLSIYQGFFSLWADNISLHLSSSFFFQILKFSVVGFESGLKFLKRQFAALCP